jgi:hypothetical protein
VAAVRREDQRCPERCAARDTGSTFHMECRRYAKLRGSGEGWANQALSAATPMFVLALKSVEER